MRALSHCDFCGTDAVGTFELLPPELEPTEDEQRRVVLCASCERTLADLVEPLLAKAGVNSTTDSTDVDPDPEATSATETRAGDSRSNETVAFDEQANDDPVSEPDTASDDRGSTVDDEPDSERASDGEERSTESPNPSEASAEPSASVTTPPEGYGNVIRLLRNRELPIERSAVESLAASAYDLESHEIDDILEYALEQGEIGADGDRIVQPE